MSPDDVASFALQNMRNGPVCIASEHYKAIEKLRSMPRRDALVAMAASMKK